MATDTIRYHEVRIYAEDGVDDITAIEELFDTNNVEYLSMVFSSDAVDACKEPLLTWPFGDAGVQMDSMDWPCIIYKDRRYENSEMFLDVSHFAQTSDDLQSDFFDKVETTE